MSSSLLWLSKEVFKDLRLFSVFKFTVQTLSRANSCAFWHSSGHDQDKDNDLYSGDQQFVSLSVSRVTAENLFSFGKETQTCSGTHGDNQISSTVRAIWWHVTECDRQGAVSVVVGMLWGCWGRQWAGADPWRGMRCCSMLGELWWMSSGSSAGPDAAVGTWWCLGITGAHGHFCDALCSCCGYINIFFPLSSAGLHCVQFLLDVVYKSVLSGICCPRGFVLKPCRLPWWHRDHVVTVVRRDRHWLCCSEVIYSQ